MRFHLIDALRGVAATWVVFYHAYEGHHIEKLAGALPDGLVYILFELGDSGVPIFFVLSGFVIAHSISRDKVNATYLAKFTLRRSIRLDPPYWGSIVLALSMGWISATVQQEVFEGPGPESILAHLFYLQGILEITHINIIYWTLCLEIQFYLVFCLVILGKQIGDKYFSSSAYLVFSCVGIFSLLWPTKLIEVNFYPGLFFPFWYGFLIGSFAYLSWKKAIPKHLFYVYWLVIFISSAHYDSKFGLATAITAILIHESARLNRITSMNWRWIQFLGLISYSMYLTHNPITGATFFIVYKALGNSIYLELVAFLINIAVVVVFSYLFWWVFERWSIHLSKAVRLHSTRPA